MFPGRNPPEKFLEKIGIPKGNKSLKELWAQEERGQRGPQKGGKRALVKFGLVVPPGLGKIPKIGRKLTRAQRPQLSWEPSCPKLTLFKGPTKGVPKEFS